MNVETKDHRKNSGDFISRFEIITKLGSGGMGIVYKAFDPALNKEVGLKVLKAGCLSDDRQIRFQQEAKALKDLRHPSIPEIYNFAISEEDEPYIVMEYVEGKSLASHIKDGIDLSLVQIRDILISVCNALAYAHSHGIVHRDIKPDNIIITDIDSPTVKLIDFGLAKLEADLYDSQDMTKTGQIVGTPPYMSPEQIRGFKTTAQSDIYSIGCVFYELVKGNPPFEGKTPLDVVSKHLAEPIQGCLDALPETAKDSIVFNIIKKCIQKEEMNRYQSVDELIQDFEKISEERTETKSSERSGLFAVMEESSPSSRGKIIISVIVLLIGLCSVAYFYYSKESKVEKVATQSKQVTENSNNTSDIDAWKYSPTNAPGHWYAVSRTTDSDFSQLIKKGNVYAITSTESDTITGSGLAAIKGLPLNGITLSSSQLNDEAIKNASKFNQLHQLDIEEAKQISSESFVELQRLKSLTVFGYKNSTLKPGMIDNIAQIKQLKSLTLKASKPLSTLDLKKLTNLKGLHSLTISATGLNPEAMKQLKEFPKLKQLWAASLNISDKELPYIANLPLEIVDLSANTFTDKSLPLLYKNKSLRKIALVKCNNISQKSLINFKYQMERRKGSPCEVYLQATYIFFSTDIYPFKTLKIIDRKDEAHNINRSSKTGQ